MRVYSALSELPRPRSYVGKFLLVAFIGVHVPLIAVAVYVISRAQLTDALSILVVMLIATLAGTLVTLYVQARLLAPLIESSQALDEFVQNRKVPALPTRYADEAGLLMLNTQTCIQTLDELLRMKNDLLATLSHDARSPITSIRLASQLGRQASEDSVPDRSELGEMFDIIDAASERQMNMMNNLLTMARSESGKLTVDRGEVDPAVLLNRVVSGFRIQADAKNVELKVEKPADTHGAVLLDPVKTEQILGNLISNALKFTPSGGTIVVRLEEHPEEVSFSVRDSGVGMPASVQKTLFQPFGGGQRPGTNEEQGTGLGLWITRTFTEVQGGTVGFESEEGKGTEFTVRLPRG